MQARIESSQYGLALLCFLILSLGLIAFSLSVASEFKKSKAKDMKLDGNLCHLPTSPAFILGILACLCVLVAQIIGNIVLVMHFRSAKSEVMAWKKSTIILMVVLSWISFVLAIILLGVSTSMNRMQPYGQGWLDGECYVVKDGIYNAAGGLIVLTVTFMLISILGTRTKFCGKQIEQHRIHNTDTVSRPREWLKPNLNSQT